MDTYYALGIVRALKQLSQWTITETLYYKHDYSDYTGENLDLEVRNLNVRLFDSQAYALTVLSIHSFGRSLH